MCLGWMRMEVWGSRNKCRSDTSALTIEANLEITAIRGMLFEEAVLFLLRGAGYNPVTSIGTDPTLRPHSAGIGISVVGRGAHHQIDAIADYLMPQPFGHPQRLLVEAKCYTNRRPVDIDCTRSAVGVLKDVSEFWNTVDGLPSNHRRYHYQKAIFSATTFTAPAERYAFAHDIYLIPMGSSACFKGLLDAIFRIRADSVKNEWGNRDARPLRTLRLGIRDHLNQINLDGPIAAIPNALGDEWSAYSKEVARLGGVIVALVGRSFPLFLVPSERAVFENLDSEVFVRIRYASTQGWTLTNTRDEILFSFDLPPVLFHMYAESQRLTRAAAAQMKHDVFTDLQAIIFQSGVPRVVRFIPDPEWFERLQNFARENAEVLLVQAD
jgi:hypothetical protein